MTPIKASKGTERDIGETIPDYNRTERGFGETKNGFGSATEAIDEIKRDIG